MKKEQPVSVGDIARRIDQPMHRVAYIVRERRIEPLLACGGRYFYDEAEVQHVQQELNAIDSRKQAIAALKHEASRHNLPLVTGDEVSSRPRKPK